MSRLAHRPQRRDHAVLASNLHVSALMRWVRCALRLFFRVQASLRPASRRSFASAVVAEEFSDNQKYAVRVWRRDVNANGNSVLTLHSYAGSHDEDATIGVTNARYEEPVRCALRCDHVHPCRVPSAAPFFPMSQA